MTTSAIDYLRQAASEVAYTQGPPRIRRTPDELAAMDRWLREHGEELFLCPTGARITLRACEGVRKRPDIRMTGCEGMIARPPHCDSCTAWQARAGVPLDTRPERAPIDPSLSQDHPEPDEDPVESQSEIQKKIREKVQKKMEVVDMRKERHRKICLRCKETKFIAARGLCGKCYQDEKKRNSLADYPPIGELGSALASRNARIGTCQNMDCKRRGVELVDSGSVYSGRKVCQQCMDLVVKADMALDVQAPQAEAPVTSPTMGVDPADALITAEDAEAIQPVEFTTPLLDALEIEPSESGAWTFEMPPAGAVASGTLHAEPEAEFSFVQFCGEKAHTPTAHLTLDDIYLNVETCRAFDIADKCAANLFYDAARKVVAIEPLDRKTAMSFTLQPGSKKAGLKVAFKGMRLRFNIGAKGKFPVEKVGDLLVIKLDREAA